MITALPRRVFDKISPEPMSGCWLWTGCVVQGGYGQVSWCGKMRPAHRIVYELTRGAIPDGLTLDHLCRRPGCVNPDHLEPVTMRENILRGSGPPAMNARKTHCKEGHPIAPPNVYVNKRGHKQCRECVMARSLRVSEGKRSAAA